MNPRTRELLQSLNRDFYEKHAGSFDSTRDHPWPGFRRVLDRLPSGPRTLLDAGCGNGRFALFLAETERVDVAYTGIDASQALLSSCRKRTRHLSRSPLRFVRCDLLQERDLPVGPFDAIVLFGVLHHVPGFEQRVKLITRLASRLAPGGFLAATLWRFGSDPRVAGRTVAWQDQPIGIDPAELEPGDHLLRWGTSPDVVRYCHFVDDPEVERLLARAGEAGLELIDRFRSDGKTGDLNEYLVWSRRDA